MSLKHVCLLCGGACKAPAGNVEQPTIMGAQLLLHVSAQLSETTRVVPPATGSRLGHCGYRPQPSV